MAANKNVIIGIRGKVPDKSQRTSVEPPPLGSFSRMPRFITETKSRKAAPRLRRYAKIVSLSALGLSLLAVPLGLWVQSRHDLDQEIVASKPNSQEMVRVANKFPAPKEEDAIRLVKLALAKRNVTDLGKIIRMGETSAQEIIEFLGSLQEREGKAEQFDWMAGMDANGLQIEGVLVRFGETHNRLAMLTPDETGTWLMDFDSFARRVKPAWTQILSAPAIEAQVRIYVGRDAYYNGAFPTIPLEVLRAGVSGLQHADHGICRTGQPATYRAGERSRRQGDQPGGGENPPRRQHGIETVRDSRGDRGRLGHWRLGI